jgi:hypothetical protein
VICAAIQHYKCLLRLNFLLSTIVGARPHRSSAKQQERIWKLVSDPAAAAEVSDHIAAGVDVTDMRFVNGARHDPSFDPYLASLVEILEERSQLATHDRRHEGADDAMVLRPTPLAAPLPALMRQALARLQSNPEHAAKLASGELKVPSEFTLAHAALASVTCISGLALKHLANQMGCAAAGAAQDESRLALCQRHGRQCTGVRAGAASAGRRSAVYQKR